MKKLNETHPHTRSDCNAALLARGLPLRPEPVGISYTRDEIRRLAATRPRPSTALLAAVRSVVRARRDGTETGDEQPRAA